MSAARRSTAGSLAVAIVLIGSGVQAQSPSASPVPSSAPPVDRGSVVICPAAVPGAPQEATQAPTASFAPAVVKPAPATKPVGTWAGTWTQMPPAPIAARSGAATDVAPFGGAMVIWSGYGAGGRLLWDGATFDPAAGTWSTIDASPLAPRTGFGFEVGGRGSMFIWGGIAEDGTPLADGAYMVTPADRDDSSVAWRPLPTAPLAAGPAFASGDVMNWTYVVAPGTDPAHEPSFAFMQGIGESWAGPTAPLSPKAPVDQPPVPLGVGYEVVTPTMDSPLFISYQTDGTAIVSRWQVLKGWSQPRRVPLPAGAGCPAVDQPWLGWIRTAADGSPIGLIAPAFRVGPWRYTSTPPADAVTDGMVVWGPGHLIVADALLAYSTGSDRWLRLPALPDGPRTGVSAAWANGNLYVWGGRTADGAVTNDGWMFTPDLPANTYRLPGRARAGYGDCGGEGIDTRITLHADRNDPELVWFAGDGRRHPTTWPDGYVVRFGEQIVVLDPDGRVVAREGERLRDIKLPYCPSNGSVHF